jgi:hypothetical protein
MPITFDSFTRVSCRTPTWVMPLPSGKMLQVQKFDEDEEQGYGYIISELGGDSAHEITRAYFDGFGTSDAPGDVLHTIRLFLEE